MSRQKVYLDTSVISALFDNRAPERMSMTEAAWVKLSEYDVYISDRVLDEVNRAANQILKEKMLGSIIDFSVLTVNETALQLANIYIEHGIFPEAYIDDAIHAALASINNIGYLLSWNYRHLVKVKTKRLVSLVNALVEYPNVEIITPPEL